MSQAKTATTLGILIALLTTAYAGLAITPPLPSPVAAILAAAVPDGPETVEALIDGDLEGSDESAFFLSFRAVPETDEPIEGTRSANLATAGPHTESERSNAIGRVTALVTPGRFRLEQIREFSYSYQAPHLELPANWGHYIELDSNGDGSADVCLVYQDDAVAVAEAPTPEKLTYGLDTKYRVTEGLLCTVSVVQKLALRDIQLLPALARSVVLQVTVQFLSNGVEVQPGEKEWPAGQPVRVDGLSMMAAAAFCPSSMGDVLYDAACKVAEQLGVALGTAVGDDGKVEVQNNVDADQDGRPDVAKITLVPANSSLIEMPDPGCIDYWRTKPGATNDQKAAGIQKCVTEPHWPPDNRTLRLFFQLDYFFTDDDPATPDEIYNDLPTDGFDYRVPGVMIYNPSDGSRETDAEDRFHLSDGFGPYEIALYQRALFVPGGEQEVCVLCVDLDKRLLVFDETPTALGLIDIDTTGSLGATSCTAPPALSPVCENSILEGVDYEDDNQADMTPSVVLIKIGPTAKKTAVDPLITNTRETWSDRMGLDLSTIHIKRAGDNPSDPRPDHRYHLYSNIDDDDSTDWDEFLCGSNPSNPYADCEDLDGDWAKNLAEPAGEELNPVRLTLSASSGAAPFSPSIEYHCLVPTTTLSLGDVDGSGGSLSNVEKPAVTCDARPHDVVLGPMANATQPGPYLNSASANRVVPLSLKEVRPNLPDNIINRQITLNPSSPPIAIVDVTGDGGAQPVLPTIMVTCGVTTGALTAATLNLGNIDADLTADADESQDVTSLCGPNAFQVTLPGGYLNTGAADKLVTVTLTVNSDQPTFKTVTDQVLIPGQATPNFEVIIPDAAVEAPYSPDVSYRCRLPVSTTFVSAQLSLGDVDQDGTVEADEIIAVTEADCDDVAHSVTLPGPYLSSGSVQRNVSVVLTVVTSRGSYSGSDQVHLAGYAPALLTLTVPAAAQEAPFKPVITYSCNVPEGDTFLNGQLSLGDVDDSGGAASGAEIIPLTSCNGTVETATIPGLGYLNNDMGGTPSVPQQRTVTVRLTANLEKSLATESTGTVRILPNTKETTGTFTAACIEGNCPGGSASGSTYKVQFTFTEGAIGDPGQAISAVSVIRVTPLTTYATLTKDPDGKWRGNATFPTNTADLQVSASLVDTGGQTGTSTSNVKIPKAVVVNYPPVLRDSVGSTSGQAGDPALKPTEQASLVANNVTVKFFARSTDLGAAGRWVNGATVVSQDDPVVAGFPKLFYGPLEGGQVANYAVAPMALSPGQMGNTTVGKNYEASVNLIIGKNYGYYFQTKDGGSPAPIQLGPSADRVYITLEADVKKTPIAFARTTIDGGIASGLNSLDLAIDQVCGYDPDERPHGVERLKNNPDGCRDEDDDGVPNETDNCDATPNPNQADGDGDDIGDACDPNLQDGPKGDKDGDGVENEDDNCDSIPNANQNDLDGDGLGDVCDLDRDGDGFSNETEEQSVPPSDPDDADSVPDDVDGDGVLNDDDDCPLDPACSTDADGDGVDDTVDNCPGLANDQDDGDGDGFGDDCDTFPNNPNEWQDTDVPPDGWGDNGDNCPTISNPDQKNQDLDGEGDVCDDDRDGDGFSNADELAGEPADPLLGPQPSDPDDPKSTPLDGDGDGAPNALDPDTTFIPDPMQALFNGDCDAVGAILAQDPDDDCGRFDSGQHTGPFFQALEKALAGGVPDPGTFVPANDLDPEDPHDTDRDGDKTEKNGQIDIVERFAFYYDVDELEENATDKYDGTNGATLYVYNPKVNLFANPQLRLVVRFGDVSGTDLQEVLMIEEYSTAVPSVPTRVTCAVQSTQQTDGVAPSPTLFVYQGAQAFRATETAPCGDVKASDNHKLTTPADGSLGFVLWNDDKRDLTRDGTTDNGDASQKSKDDVMGFKLATGPVTRLDLSILAGDFLGRFTLEQQSARYVVASSSFADYDPGDMKKEKNQTAKVTLDIEKPLLSKVEITSQTTKDGPVTRVERSASPDALLNDPLLDVKKGEDDVLLVSSTDSDGDGIPDKVGVTHITPTSPSGCLTTDNNRCGNSTVEQDVPPPPSFEDGDCVGNSNTTFNICNTGSDRRTLLQRTPLGDAWPGIRVWVAGMWVEI